MPHCSFQREITWPPAASPAPNAPPFALPAAAPIGSGRATRSDSGSDVQNEHGFDALDEGEIGGESADLASDTDAAGTGEHGAAVHDTDIVEGADIAPDRIESIDANDDTDIEAASRQAIDALAADDDPAGEDAVETVGRPLG